MTFVKHTELEFHYNTIISTIHNFQVPNHLIREHLKQVVAAAEISQL